MSHIFVVLAVNGKGGVFGQFRTVTFS